MLDQSLKGQLGQYLGLLENDVVLRASLGEGKGSQEVKTFLEEVVSLSDKLSISYERLPLSPSFAVDRSLCGASAGTRVSVICPCTAPSGRTCAEDYGGTKELYPCD